MIKEDGSTSDWEATGNYGLAFGYDSKVEPKCKHCNGSGMTMVGRTADPLSGWIAECTECPECKKK